MLVTKAELATALEKYVTQRKLCYMAKDELDAFFVLLELYIAQAMELAEERAVRQAKEADAVSGQWR